MKGRKKAERILKLIVVMRLLYPVFYYLNSCILQQLYIIFVALQISIRLSFLDTVSIRL